MPGKSTALKVRHLSTAIQTTYENGGDMVIFFLDAKKAFNWIEWLFLWETILRNGLWPYFY